MGLDAQKRKDLLAQVMTANEMNDYLKSDTLSFLSENQLLSVMQKVFKPNNSFTMLKKNGGWCTACFPGSYQDQMAQKKVVLSNTEEKCVKILLSLL